MYTCDCTTVGTSRAHDLTYVPSIGLIGMDKVIFQVLAKAREEAGSELGSSLLQEILTPQEHSNDAVTGRLNIKVTMYCA